MKNLTRQENVNRLDKSRIWDSTYYTIFVVMKCQENQTWIVVSRMMPTPTNFIAVPKKNEPNEKRRSNRFKNKDLKARCDELFEREFQVSDLSENGIALLMPRDLLVRISVPYPRYVTIFLRVSDKSSYAIKAKIARFDLARHYGDNMLLATSVVSVRKLA